MAKKKKASFTADQSFTEHYIFTPGDVCMSSQHTQEAEAEDPHILGLAYRIRHCIKTTN